MSQSIDFEIPTRVVLLSSGGAVLVNGRVFRYREGRWWFDVEEGLTIPPEPPATSAAE